MPNFIFPFTSPAAYGTWNLDDMQELMYRPLYWFGNGESPTINYPLSLAGAPVWSSNSKSVTITLKPYKWSNGETVTSTDILFWMNMYKVEKDNFGGYVPGGLPGQRRLGEGAVAHQGPVQPDRRVQPHLVPVQRTPDRSRQCPTRGTAPPPGRATAPPT